ncbi:beta-N-acetylhexosaminidase [Marinilabilia rubra]|uniref:beta-N-acetylhexosaminidase n=2 Tax=Marinilabilia rubra TaxID=2162893 RepID=A0A2U2BBZ0_9BACT|nr:beta-N-acetylhexosaminidase [Marinilabilia rubra]
MKKTSQIKWGLILLLILGFTITTTAQKENVPHLLPMPQQVEWHSGNCPASFRSVSGDDETGLVVEWLDAIGLKQKEASPVTILINKVGDIREATVNKNEAYRLNIQDNSITIDAVTNQGIYRAIQTLRQLIVSDHQQPVIKASTITDWPAFRIRGFMHDTGRGFIPFDELKKQIELLARFKINVFHWHLTEDIGWRLESKVFPQLTDSSNFERLPGKYYTIDQARELVDFCKKHHVLLIPEIDMPGHSAAFTRAIGHDMQSEKGMEKLKVLMDEICEVFAELPYIHIGTDEVRFTNPDFVPEMVSYIRDKGKKVISWNPGWHYQSDEIDMIQMWSSRGELLPGTPAIDSRLHYINHFDSFADIVALYHSNVAGVKEGTPDVAGAIIALWNDRHVESTEDILSQNGFYPSMLTLAESTWKGGREKYFYERGTLIKPDEKTDYPSFTNFETRMLHFKQEAFAAEPFAYVKQSNVKWRITEPFPNGGDLTKTFPPEKKIKKKYRWKKDIYETSLATGAGIYLRHVWGTLVPSFYENPQPNHTAYAYTWIYSPEQQEAGLHLRFQNYSRSEKDIPPPQGKWDFNESKAWLNGNEISPPNWENQHRERTSEISLRNENWEGNAPIPVTLQKGWNKLLLKLPVGEFTSDEVRLVKWMFNAVLVTPDGGEALEGIIYSPDKKLKR